MKKVTIIIGNGFDCKNKLKTGYCDFLDWYLKQPNPQSRSIREFKKTINEGARKNTEIGKYGLWSYLEKQMGQYDPGSVESFIECYDDIVEKMIDYLKQQDGNKYLQDVNEGRNADELPAGLKCFLTHFYDIKSNNDSATQAIKSTFNNEKWEFNFISLNYTALIVDCVKKTKGTVISESSYPKGTFDNISIGKCLNPHGVFPNIVFGVSEESQLINPNYALNNEFKRRMIKKNQVVNYGIQDYELSFQVIDDSDIVCLYGLSIGDTDNHWWRHIAKWLQTNNDHKLIIYVHKSNGLNESKEESEIINKFIDFCSNDIYIKNQIAITFDEQKFAELFLHASVSSSINISSSANLEVTKTGYNL